MTRLFLIAGEPSGDRLGAALMAGLRELEPDVEMAGIGGPAMAAEGLHSLFPMEDLSVMGVTEVLPRLPHLLRRRDEAAAAVLATAPDALVTIDSPDFCLRVAARARRTRPDLLVIHYVAPSVWAWRPGRATRMARHVDHVLALLPFEPPLMEAAGMTCDFVGHPVVAEPQATEQEIGALTDTTGPDIALVLPGSRRGEVARLAPVFGAALGQLPAGFRVVVPTVPHLVDTVRQAVRDWPGDPLVVTDPAQKRATFTAARAALAASGTVSLELAAAGTPMVIAYDMSWLTWQIVSRMMRVDTATLVNLIAGDNVVPEFLGPACHPGPVGEAFARLLTDADAREAQAQALSQAMDLLGRGGEPPGLRAARSVLTQVRK
ncbi:lipid-A-disaccharide synthase [Jannaschia rubra]|uniref:Lipid-A-disaccharide synthase n=1 Tax=Jannaschia rubra TaxID=282197 RepID=A0A0M6XUT9_9RHOB|nr:lipid-A-disaccharide synthase [Jannaschia rubra]CTQ34001.1 Lipid-A-disaccharide synthase [Jannaschia rubra]SFG25458.1 lipid-A-disaccharide synthase [Jannaschia rubra]